MDPLEQTAVALKASAVGISDYVDLLAHGALNAHAHIAPDRGGRTNVATEVHGTAKGQLAVRCADRLIATAELRDWKDFELNQSPVGPFYRLTAAIFEYATGCSADDEGVGLIRYIRTVVETTKGLVEVRQALGTLPASMTLEEWKGRSAPLEHRAITLEKQLREL